MGLAVYIGSPRNLDRRRVAPHGGRYDIDASQLLLRYEPEISYYIFCCVRFSKRHIELAARSDQLSHGEWYVERLCSPHRCHSDAQHRSKSRRSHISMKPANYCRLCKNPETTRSLRYNDRSGSRGVLRDGFHYRTFFGDRIANRWLDRRWHDWISNHFQSRRRPESIKRRQQCEPIWL